MRDLVQIQQSRLQVVFPACGADGRSRSRQKTRNLPLHAPKNDSKCPGSRTWPFPCFVREEMALYENRALFQTVNRADAVRLASIRLQEEPDTPPPPFRSPLPERPPLPPRPEYSRGATTGNNTSSYTGAAHQVTCSFPFSMSLYYCCAVLFSLDQTLCAFSPFASSLKVSSRARIKNSTPGGK